MLPVLAISPKLAAALSDSSALYYPLTDNIDEHSHCIMWVMYVTRALWYFGRPSYFKLPQIGFGNTEPSC